MATRLKPLLNYSEDLTYKELVGAVKDDPFSVFVKVRVADVLPIENSGISEKHYSYALKAHFDFVVSDNNRLPQFAVEFDGPLHQLSASQRARDTLKDELCERFGCPLLRINSNWISKRYNNLTILAWLIEVRQYEDAFYEAQSNGQVPYDEPFDPFFCLSKPGEKSVTFPYWIALPSQLKIREYYRAGHVKYDCSNGIVGRADDGSLRGIGYIQLNDQDGVSVVSGMRKQLFDGSFIDLLDQLLTIQLLEKLESTLAGEIPAEDMSAIDARIRKFRSKCKVVLAHGVSRGEGLP